MFSELFQDYRFDHPAYLEANQDGRVTGEQKAVLQKITASFQTFLKRTNRLRTLQVMGWGIFFLAAGLLSLEVSPWNVLLFFLLGVVVFGGLILYQRRAFLQKKEALQRDLTRHDIRSDAGVVVFQGSAYRISVPGKNLKLPFDNRSGLEPGVTYRFYYLQESGFVLSAEALSINPELEAITGLNDVLADANSLDKEALHENRRGILSKSQTSKLLEPVLLGAFLMLFTLGVSYFALTRDNEVSRAISGSHNVLEFVKRVNTGTLIIMAAVVGAGVGGIYLLITSLQDLFSRSVESWEGRGLRTYRQNTDTDSSTRTKYYYVIGGKEFRVNKKAYEAFENGRMYRVYFTPRRKRMVNLEVLD